MLGIAPDFRNKTRWSVFQKTIRLRSVLAVGLFLLLTACQPFSNTERQELKEMANDINAMFLAARLKIDELKKETQQLLDHPEQNKGIYNSERYQYTKDYVYYTPDDDGHCEVWASGHIPIGISERQRIRLFENLCPVMKTIYSDNDFIDTVYLTTYDSIVMGFPYADIDAYMKPGLDLTQVWVTYSAAAQKANKNRRTLWVEPYVDAVGRGYMTSVITPVYKNDFLEATLGIDITADLISDKFIALSDKNLMIVTDKTIPVAVNKNSFSHLRMRGLENYNYLKKEAENKLISDSLKMINHPNYDVRNIAKWILSPEKDAVLPISGRSCYFFKEPIPEVNWYLVQFKIK